MIEKGVLESEKIHAIYTPKVWVDRCHAMMTELFTEEWYKQPVWDLSCGDRAMTRGYNFQELYSSDIRSKVEPDFIYDATKIELDKMPDGLVDAIRNRHLIIFTNTPFGVVGRRIRKMVLGLQRLYNARIVWACITNNIATGSAPQDRQFLDEFHILSGFLFCSREFPELKKSKPWGVLFMVANTKN